MLSATDKRELGFFPYVAITIIYRIIIIIIITIIIIVINFRPKI